MAQAPKFQEDSIIILSSDDEESFVKDHHPTDDESDLPETQPYEEFDQKELQLSQEKFGEISFNDVWGWLQPTPNSKLHSVALQKDSYTFGRSEDCEYVFTSQLFESETFFGALSKHQFKIEKNVHKDAVSVVLHDLSTNGTFVNGSKVGKGEHKVLTNNDEISLVFPKNAVFVFIDNSFISEWLPTPEMRGRYNLKVLLGKGGFGEVRMALDKINKKDVAIKKIEKSSARKSGWDSELAILRQAKHRFIVSMEDFFETTTHAFIVLEYISGGTLFDKMCKVEKLNDENAKFIFYQLVLGLEFLHCQGIAHRDLKPENVLLAPYKEGELVKLSDFGLSKICNILDVADLKTMCGTLRFVAPEIISNTARPYTLQVDIWSLGVAFFFCISGLYPFSEEREAMPVAEQIIRGSYSMRGPEWRQVNHNLARLIRRMLVREPTERIKLAEIKSNVWFQDDRMHTQLNRLIKAVDSGSRCVTVCDSPGQPTRKRARRDGAETIRKS